MNGSITDRTFAPSLLTQGEIMQDTCPAEDMPTAGDLCCSRWIQAYWAGGHFMATNSLKEQKKIVAKTID